MLVSLFAPRVGLALIYCALLPHIGRTIDSTVEAINAGLQSLKAGAPHAGQGGGGRGSRPGGGKLRSARERGRQLFSAQSRQAFRKKLLHGRAGRFAPTAAVQLK
jgi:hypothetical protein